MFEKTHTDELIRYIEQNAPTPSEIIKELFDSFDPSHMHEGVRYYKGESDILNRKIYSYEDGVKVIDTEATNEKVVSGFHKILVDQKTAYLVGEPMVFGSRSDNQEHLDLLQELIGERWEDTIPELIKGASNKGLEWLHPFVNEEGEFDYMIIPAEQLIPIYDYSKRKKLVAAIRFYQLDDNITKLELWTSDDVTYYEMINGQIYLDATVEVNPAPHFTDVEGVEWKSWGRVPFIKFANNEEELSDLHFYKSIIDAYDLLVSDAQNTLSDMQSLVWALVGYEGEKLDEFMANLKRYKAIKLDTDGDVKTIRAEVPVDSYKTQIDILKENIYAFGQGVNPSPDIIGDAPSGVALTNLYSLLDMKASILERKFTLALREFMWFVGEYVRHAKLGNLDYRDITFTFNKMLLTNESEIIDMAQKSQGIISQTTILENHPWVKDVAQEMARIEEERQKEMELFDNYNTTFNQLNGGGVDDQE
ncbi:phage portal protein [Ureibacillus thermophilus]|uniref:Phage portal protein n=1 Tax=Ureibacillus thermophilus TaxID=367743 RepID=A0A4P6UU84_9BACL|nr:phage portal protein [Ureibacillus thermophilus]QBK26734.1 phage portal protein [Ureibacillus thermophilus]